MKAGTPDGGYSNLIGKFHWFHFYQRHAQALTAFRQMLAARYAYTLIDSRTGFTDIGGICTMLMPEKLVAVFTPNQQSLSGVLDLAERAVEYRRASDDLRPLAVFPLASRIELAEKELRDEWRKQYQRRFQDRFKKVYAEETCDLTAYFDEVQLPHVSYYAYGEKVAVLQQRSETLSLRRAYEVFFHRLIHLDYAWEATGTSPEVPQAPIPQPKTADAAAGVSGFENDVFISYAHIDNESFGEESDRWVSVLQRNLQTRLEMLLGPRIKFYRDPRLSGDALFPETIREQLEHAAVLVSVVSPAYLASLECRRELESFIAAADRTAGLQVEGQPRVCKVLKRPVAWTDLPSVLQETLGYEFYRTDSTGRVREFLLDRDPDAQKLYWQKLDDIAQDIADTLTRIERRRRTGAADAAPASGPVVVYVAETTSDIETVREQLLRELKSRGHRILPEKPLPKQGEDLKRTVKADLDQCRLSVHLIGRQYGFIPEGEESSVVSLQHEIAAELTAQGRLTELIWMAPGLTPADTRQSEFISSLESNPGSGELLKTTVEALKNTVQERLPGPVEAISQDGRYTRYRRREYSAAHL